jgi:hypothetical protein
MHTVISQTGFGLLDAIAAGAGLGLAQAETLPPASYVSPELPVQQFNDDVRSRLCPQ